ncbi:DUF1501 domain-containing protein [Singulisphaera acidiphila]|uniref:Arylsulfatase A family protein n=1 Tax=Singulisphaera acidiphila (strain ATCC BAA-1392 / DSM 18658 / VKM B-2454 / MOB10) TaxID=886293 RepID=L0DRZ5_SINAD|nr:DUF1501 domain-containing protein [Singulisphaera acidiphila]AGA31166.1 Protein of unknown function (DUF1501) [Singulisphaera acidiphila DSM 18658]
MNCHHIDFGMSRRDFFGRFALGLGGAALGSLLERDAAAASPSAVPSPFQGILAAPHHAPRAKRIIFLFMSGGPSQLDLFDHKPLLNRMNGQDLPDSVRKGQRLTGMSGNQASLPLAGSLFSFAQHGQAGSTVSELLPWTAKIADELCFVKSLHTEAINHDPAITFFQTGSQLAGRPSMGSWLSYGLGAANENLPAFVVLISKDRIDQPLYARLWGNGFLASIHQGVQFRSGKDPVLYLDNPAGISGAGRRKMLDRLAELHAIQYEDLGDPEINARVAQYEMAYRMQTSVPEVMNVASEPERVLDLYGPEAKQPGTFAANCLLARRMAERDVRFIQLYHPGWDHHGGLPGGIRRQCQDVDRACYGLITDLKQRGLLDETLVVWGGEFGRTNYSQGKLTATDYGRDHHPRCFTMWLAGGGIKPGTTLGATDDFGYNVAEDPVHVHDLQATILHLLGIDHEKLTYKFQGRYYRLTDVHGQVMKPMLA